MENAEARHYAVYDAYNRELTIKIKDQVIAKTTQAIIVKEVGKGVYDPVFYIPKEDIQIFNKKAIYLYLREISGLNTKQLVASLSNIKKRYREFKYDWVNGDPK